MIVNQKSTNQILAHNTREIDSSTGITWRVVYLQVYGNMIYVHNNLDSLISCVHAIAYRRITIALHTRIVIIPPLTSVMTFLHSHEINYLQYRQNNYLALPTLQYRYDCHKV